MYIKTHIGINNMHNKRQTISVTLATYNEQDFLEDCLKSVADWVDEIIIVDGHSTDKTVDIAKKYKAKVLLRENNPIFHVQKQIANETAKSDWILQLDADERVPEKLKNEILMLLSGKTFGQNSWISPAKLFINKFLPVFSGPVSLDKPATAYWLTRTNFFLGKNLKNTGQYPDPVIRLFQNGKAYLPAKNVHEQMVVKGDIGWLKNDLLHFATPTFDRYLLREDRYSSLTAKELKFSKTKISIFNTLNFLFLKPLTTFCRLYFRYRGFLDGFPGFVFSVFSGLHFAFSYMKLWELYKKEDLALK